MDEQEFQRLLDLFPVVRSRDYHIDGDSSRQSTSRSMQDEMVEAWEAQWEDGDKHKINNQAHAIDLQDAFWEKLKLAVEKKVGETEAKRFCKAFQEVHHKLVYEGLSLDSARSFINSTSSHGQ